MASGSPNCGCGGDDGAQPTRTGPTLAVPPSMRSPFGLEAVIAGLAGTNNATERLVVADARLAAIAAQRGRPVVPAPRPDANPGTPQLTRRPDLSSRFALRPIPVAKPAALSLPAATTESAAGVNSLMQVSTVQPAKTRTPPQPLPLPASPERRGLEALVAAFANVRAPRPQPVSAEKLAASLGVGGVVAATARPGGAAPVLSPGAVWRAGMQGRGIQPEELVGMLSQSLDGRRMALPTEKVTILDVRTAAEFAAGHVEGAINAPNGIDASMLARLAGMKGKIVVYCETGRRSAVAMGQLVAAGFRDVVNAGGVAAAAAMARGLTDPDARGTIDGSVDKGSSGHSTPSARCEGTGALKTAKPRCTPAGIGGNCPGARPRNEGTITRPFETLDFDVLSVGLDHAARDRRQRRVALSPADLRRPIPVIATSRHWLPVFGGAETTIRSFPESEILQTSRAGEVVRTRPAATPEAFGFRVGDVLRYLAGTWSERCNRDGVWNSPQCNIPALQRIDNNGAAVDITYDYDLPFDKVLQLSVHVGVSSRGHDSLFEMKRPHYQAVFASVGYTSVNGWGFMDVPGGLARFAGGGGAYPSLNGLVGPSLSEGGAFASVGTGLMQIVPPRQADLHPCHAYYQPDDGRDIPACIPDWEGGPCIDPEIRLALREAARDERNFSNAMRRRLSNTCRRMRFEIEIWAEPAPIHMNRPCDASGRRPLALYLYRITAVFAGPRGEQYFVTYRDDVERKAQLGLAPEVRGSPICSPLWSLGVFLGVFGLPMASGRQLSARFECIEARLACRLGRCADA